MYDYQMESIVAMKIEVNQLSNFLHDIGKKPDAKEHSKRHLERLREILDDVENEFGLG